MDNNSNAKEEASNLRVFIPDITASIESLEKAISVIQNFQKQVVDLQKMEEGHFKTIERLQKTTTLINEKIRAFEPLFRKNCADNDSIKSFEEIIYTITKK